MLRKYAKQETGSPAAGPDLPQAKNTPTPAPTPAAAHAGPDPKKHKAKRKKQPAPAEKPVLFRIAGARSK